MTERLTDERLAEIERAWAEAPRGCADHFPGRHEVLSSLRRLRALPVLACDVCRFALDVHGDSSGLCEHPKAPHIEILGLDPAGPYHCTDCPDLCPLRPENRR